MNGVLVLRATERSLCHKHVSTSCLGRQVGIPTWSFSWQNVDMVWRERVTRASRNGKFVKLSTEYRIPGDDSTSNKDFSTFKHCEGAQVMEAKIIELAEAIGPSYNSRGQSVTLTKPFILQLKMYSQFRRGNSVNGRVWAKVLLSCERVESLVLKTS